MTLQSSGGWWSELRVRLSGLRIAAVPLIALCALTLLMRGFFAEHRSADTDFYQTIQVHSKVEGVLAQLRQADAVFRNYSPQGYKTVAQGLPDSVEQLRRQFAQNRELALRVRQLEPLVDREIDLLAAAREQGAEPGRISPEAPEAWLAQADQVASEIRGVLDQILKEQDGHIQQTYSNAQQGQHRSDVILLATLAFGFLGGLGSVWMLMSKLIASERERAERTVQESQAQLQTMLAKAEMQAKELEQNEELLSRAKEAAEQANRAKSEYLSRMSHELRTPLNAILGFAQLLEMAPLEQKNQESVAQILKAGRHLLSLINELLDISRIEAGRLSLSLEPVHLPPVLQEALAMIATQASARQLRLVDNCPQSNLWVLADRQRLKQVLLNLLTNAVKYNRTGGAVTVSTEDTGRAQVRIRVADSGNGIAAENIPLLFQPFERLSAEQTEVEGTGIGLALSKRLVELMSGTIGVESELGTGTTFWVDFPKGAAPDGEADFSRQLAAAAHAVESVQQPTVLCIEDNPSNLRLIEQIFASLPGIRLISALQGEEGLKLAAEQQPNLILLDVHLPDLDGREVLVRLKADPATAAIPVMVVSADATVHQEQRMWEAGACRYLTKPIDVQKLTRAVEDILQYEATV